MVGEGEFEFDGGEPALPAAPATRPIEPDNPAALSTATKSRERNSAAGCSVLSGTHTAFGGSLLEVRESVSDPTARIG